MRLLVLGGNGVLGSNVVSAAMARGWEVVATHHSDRPGFDVPSHQLDIRDSARFESLLDRVDPAAVVNCAAMTDVDGCESDPDLARAINGDAPGKVAEVCAARGSAFCHVSTDYVFDGSDRELYGESADPNPIQVYGESKLAGDAAVRDAHPSPLVVRPSFVYGVHRPDGSLAGFPAWVRDRLLAGETLSLFTDQHVTPSRAGQVASVLLRLLADGERGTCNVACRTCTTPYDIGVALRERLGREEVPIEAASQGDVDRPADRPRHTCLDVSKVEDRLDTAQPTLDEDLAAIEPALTAE